MNELIYHCVSLPLSTTACMQKYKQLHNLEVIVIGTWASWKPLGKKFDTFTTENLEFFQILIDKAEVIIGFNSIQSDDLLFQAHGINITTNFDLLYELLGRTVDIDFKIKSLTGKYNQILIESYPKITQYSLDKFAKVNLNSRAFMSNQEIYTSLNNQKKNKVIQECIYQIKQLKKLKDLYDQRRLYDPFCGRPVGHRFIIPVPTKTLYQKMVAFALGALFRPDGNYAFLCRYKDYEHYALLCCERAD